MKITKFTFLLVGLVSASASVKYHLRENPDSSIIGGDVGRPSEKFANGIVGMDEQEIKRYFRINTDETIDHLYNLSIGTDKRKLAYEEDQHGIFMNAMEQELDHLQLERARAYKHAKETEHELEAESGKFLFKDKMKIQELENKLSRELDELKAVDKKLLKLKAFDQYCHLEGCLVKRTKSLFDGISGLFGSNKENKNNVSENRNVFNIFSRKTVKA